MLSVLSEQVEIDGAEHIGEADMEIYGEFLQKTEMLVSLLKEEDSIHGLLTETLIADCTYPDDGTAMYIYETKDKIIKCLTTVMNLNIAVNEIFNDLQLGNELDIEHKYSFLKETEFAQIITYNKKFGIQYRFRSLTDYYTFLLIRFLSAKPNVTRCECCGRYFLPKTKKKTLYCDRIIRNDKSCKQLAPALKHKLAAKNSKVIEEYDRANQRMYKRYERTANYNQKPSAVDLTYAEYYEWHDAAVKARDGFLAGSISEEDALKAIIHQ